MGLLERVSNVDTVAELDRASEHRYLDGIGLYLAHEFRSTGAVYVLGYVAEMLIKSAYYRVRGVGPCEDLRAELRGMEARAMALGYAWTAGRSRHQVESLAGLLAYERRARGCALLAELESGLLGHASLIASHWSESLRYKDAVATEHEVNEVLSSVEWLIANHSLLWR